VPCSLTYDDTLARVRIDADALCVTGSAAIVDTFSRTVTGGWTTADTGQPWTVTGGSASDYSVASGVGRQNNVTENVFRMATLDGGSTDCDLTIEVATDKAVAGASQIVEVIGRSASATSVDNSYMARLTFTTASAVTVDVRRRVAGTPTTITSTVTTGLTHAAGTSFSIRFSVQGTSLKARVWLTSASEPTTWDVEVTDTQLVAGTHVGVRSVLASGTSNEPVVFSFDDLRSATATYATVDRTTDGVTYTVVRGASDVGVTTGCELERIVDDYEFPVGQTVTYRVRSFDHQDVLVTTTTCQIEVDLTSVWFKSIGRPFLNVEVDCVLNPSPIVRRARNGVFPIVGRSYPVAVTDLRGSREVTAQVVTRTTEARESFDLLLASGDPIYVQTPLAYPLPTMYAVVGDTAEQRPVRNRDCGDDWRLWDLPLTEVVAPGPDVVGSTSTWQTVVNTYATWADVMAAHSSWADLLELVGDGTEVIVP
jgi:hypothetical protein